MSETATEAPSLAKAMETSRPNPELAPVYLALHHSERTITTETPSEYDLDQRIQAQIAMVQRAIELSRSRCS